MKEKKAFTLVELLGVIVILGLIAIATFPNIITLLKKYGEKDYERFVKDLQLVTESYVNDNIDKLNLKEPGDVEFIELGDLVNAGYLSKKKINPKTEKEIELNTTMMVTVLNDKTRNYEYTGVVNGIQNYRINNLKVMYDGYNKLKENNGQIIWEDVMGNIAGVLINGAGVEDWYDNRIKLYDIANYIQIPGSSSLIPYDSDVTIEIVYEIPSEGQDLTFRNQGLGLYYFDLYTDGLILSMVRNSTDTANYWPAATSLAMRQINKVHTLAVTMKKNEDLINFNYYGDGKALQMSSATGLKYNNDDFTIGKDYTTEASVVNIYGFRLYDAALTEEEIAKNHEIDINRYSWRGK
ncbi:MAG: hypothetical protein GX190_03130 [Mollicutes bacterium]|nr:hypothetical protein [Mollicutes bacterium]